MEGTTINKGPESPADLEWSQGAKNPRKENQTSENIDRGMPQSNTTDQDVKATTETSNGEICVEYKAPYRIIILQRCRKIIESNAVVFEKFSTNDNVVVIINNENATGVFEKEEADQIIAELLKFVASLSHSNIRPKFDEYQLEQGYLILTCHNQETVVWVKNCIRIDLTLALNKNISGVSHQDYEEPTRISTFLPGPRRHDDRIYKILVGQNPSLQWVGMKIYRSKQVDDGSGTNVVFYANTQTMKKLAKLSMKTYYGLSRAEYAVTTLEQCKTELCKPSPRNTLTSKFFCQDFIMKSKELWNEYKRKRYAAGRHRPGVKKPDWINKSKATSNKSKATSAPRNSRQRRRFKRNNLSRTDDSPKRTKTETANPFTSKSSRTGNRSSGGRKPENPPKGSRLPAQRRFESKRNAGGRYSRAAREAPSSSIPSLLGAPPAQNDVLPQLAQLSHLLQSINALSSQITGQSQSWMPTHPSSSRNLNRERIPESFNYRIQEEVPRSRSEIPPLLSGYSQNQRSYRTSSPPPPSSFRRSGQSSQMFEQSRYSDYRDTGDQFNRGSEYAPPGQSNRSLFSRRDASYTSDLSRFSGSTGNYDSHQSDNRGANDNRRPFRNTDRNRATPYDYQSQSRFEPPY